jgi:hypothetical protein
VGRCLNIRILQSLSCEWAQHEEHQLQPCIILCVRLAQHCPRQASGLCVCGQPTTKHAPTCTASAPPTIVTVLLAALAAD